ncbi:Protein patched/dispatched [Trinorchestia longiramus]|nr:Protein patched/dispatched [Trinorchestia longiramus]
MQEKADGMSGVLKRTLVWDILWGWMRNVIMAVVDAMKYFLVHASGTVDCLSMSSLSDVGTSTPLYSAGRLHPKIHAHSFQNNSVGNNESCENGGAMTLEDMDSTNSSQTFPQKKDISHSTESSLVVQSCLSRFSRSISLGLENLFYSYGKTVATYPCLFILLCLAVTGISSIGLLTFHMEERPFKLWIPQDSDFIQVAEWQKINFPNKYRIHASLFEADNVLTREVLLDLLLMHEVVSNTVAWVTEDLRHGPGEPPLGNSTHGDSLSRETSQDLPAGPHDGRTTVVAWEDVCSQLPSIISTSIFGRKKRSLNSERKNLLNPSDFLQAHKNRQNIFVSDFQAPVDVSSVGLDDFSGIYDSLNSIVKDNLKNAGATSSTLERHRRQAGVDWSTILPRGAYCALLEQLNTQCFERSLLEVWGYDRGIIESLTQQDIINDVNTVETSAVFGVATNFTRYLSGITRDDQGRIVGAKAMTQTWLSVINPARIVPGQYIDEFGTGTEIDVDTYHWEEEFVKNVLNASHYTTSKFYFMSAGSFGKISKESIEGDLGLLIVGYVVVFIYIQIMLGKFNGIETRPFLSLMGIVAVQLSIVVSYGLSSAFGQMFTPVNNILPFLVLGLGIDDMFVIMQAWNNLSKEEQQQPLNVRVGYTMKHAGASITVTSATDIVAFAIGSMTVLPALRSFCVYAAIGIGAVFFFQATFFVAWFAFDQRRSESRRHGVLCCFKLSDDYKVNDCSQRDLCQTFFGGVYSTVLLHPITKGVVLVGTTLFFCVSCWGFSNLKQEFDAVWFLPQNSYLFKYLMKRSEYFSWAGVDGVVYLGNVSLYDQLHQIQAFVEALEQSEYVGTIDTWYTGFKNYFEGQGYPVPDPEATYDTFQEDLGAFLFSPSGSKYRERNFQFIEMPSCSNPAPLVTASSFDFRYRILYSTREENTAMHALKSIAHRSNITGFVQPFSRMHSGWETDEIIEQELYQNMILALIVVFLMTLALIASLVQSLFVLLCVIMTLVDVFALMHWWGLTIDTVSCIDMVLAIGLCVDYAAHVGHVFMTCGGSRDARARHTLARIGPAVLNGGFSTFMAFCFLAYSDSHVFKTFFKVFFGVCLYGLFHGLVFLPVLLSLIGPNAYDQHAAPPITELDQNSAPMISLKPSQPMRDRDVQPVENREAYQPIPVPDARSSPPIRDQNKYRPTNHVSPLQPTNDIVYIDDEGDEFVDASCEMMSSDDRSDAADEAYGVSRPKILRLDSDDENL